MGTMKAISLWQPWASAVARRAKFNETRHWATSYRGTLAIHAAKRFPLGEMIYYSCCYNWRGALGRFAWAFADIRPLRNPVKCRGRQSLWTLDAETERAVWAEVMP